LWLFAPPMRPILAMCFVFCETARPPIVAILRCNFGSMARNPLRCFSGALGVGLVLVLFIGVLLLCLHYCRRSGIVNGFSFGNVNFPE
jgi:hypothetical protein